MSLDDGDALGHSLFPPYWLQGLEDVVRCAHEGEPRGEADVERVVLQEREERLDCVDLGSTSFVEAAIRGPLGIDADPEFGVALQDFVRIPFLGRGGLQGFCVDSEVRGFQLVGC